MIYILSLMIAYAILVFFWQARERLRANGQFEGIISYAYSGILGIIGASVLSLQWKTFAALEITNNDFILIGLSILLMLLLCGLLYFLFVKKVVN
ncbi:MAG: hypothetical protein AAFP19_10040 [Bacteroidota bacterium]